MPGAFNSDLSSPVSDDETICNKKLKDKVFSPKEHNLYDSDSYREAVEEPKYSEKSSLAKEDAQILNTLPLSSENLAVSLLSIVADHIVSNEHLAALLRRDKNLIEKNRFLPDP